MWDRRFRGIPNALVAPWLLNQPCTAMAAGTCSNTTAVTIVYL